MTTDSPFSVSIVIPTYNRLPVLKRAIASVISQASDHLELVVVDDGSRDGTAKYLKNIDDRRVRWIIQENKGRSAARNRGAAEARGTILSFLDSDDELTPGWMIAFHEAFKKQDVGIVCAGIVIPEDTKGGKEVLLPHDLGPHYGNQTGRFSPPGTFAVLSRLFHAVEGYDERLHYAENTDLALRIVEECLSSGLKVISIDKPLVVFHRKRLRYARRSDLFQQRLRSAEIMLARHKERYVSNGLHAGYANYLAIAGVSAARLGKKRRAQKYFAEAIRFAPWTIKHYLRYVLSHLPAVGRMYWKRHEQ